MDREQALETALGQIERQFGKGSVMKMGDQAQVAIGAVSTGSLSLDVALGVGGLPRGNPPIPRARSSESDPVETAPTETWARSLIFITEPLPN